MQNLKENIIVDKTFSFSLEILKYAELLEEERKFVLCNQLLRSGTSIGANVREAQNAESNPDFIHKMLQGKLMNVNTGCCCASILILIHHVINCSGKLEK